MEVKIDKRTKEYKKSMEQITNPEIAVEVTREEFLKDVLLHPEPDTMDMIEQTEQPSRKPWEIPPEVDEAIKLLESRGISVNVPRVAVDLLHCPDCGVELLEGERNTRSQAHCSVCIKKNANKIVCTDGVIRDKDDCRRVTTINSNKDEVYTWVAK